MPATTAQSDNAERLQDIQRLWIELCATKPKTTRYRDLMDRIKQASVAFNQTALG